MLAEQIHKLPREWRELLIPLMSEPWFSHLEVQLSTAYYDDICAPAPNDWLRALTFCGPDQIRAVITGQDPYHGPGQAHGLAFSVAGTQKLPPSLRNIYKELGAFENLGAATTAGLFAPSGDLSRWAEQGVLLLNETLTVQLGKAGSHSDMPWRKFTAAITAALTDRPVAFMLWGAHARSRASELASLNSEHLILEAPHPSPLSAYRGFFGCGHFERVNQWLERRGESPIDWL
jgi:uracil-DNA glycosylase